MPNQQGVLFFEDIVGSLGWTEVYWLHDADTDTARTHLFTLAGLRAAAMADIYQVVAGRVSDVNLLNDSFLLVGLPIVGGIASTQLSATDPWSALNLRLECTSLHRGRLYMHGCMEAFFTAPDRKYNPGNANDAAVQAFIAALLTATDRRVKATPGPFAYTPITAGIPQREVPHKIGRPFGLLHGRRRTAPSP
jgi:hypothetical protein